MKSKFFLVGIVSLLLGCAATTINKLEPSFTIKSMEGKQIVFENNADLVFGGGLDLDGMYAQGVFEKMYPLDTAYTNEFGKKSVESFLFVSKAKLLKICNQDSVSCRNKPVEFDYRITLDKIRFHHRLELNSSYSIYNNEGKKMMEITINSIDKFGFTTSPTERFGKGITKLLDLNSLNIKGEWKDL